METCFIIKSDNKSPSRQCVIGVEMVGLTTDRLNVGLGNSGLFSLFLLHKSGLDDPLYPTVWR